MPLRIVFAKGDHIVNSTDLFDGTKTVMHTPTGMDEPTPTVLP